jgi:hypothetical protein
MITPSMKHILETCFDPMLLSNIERKEISSANGGLMNHYFFFPPNNPKSPPPDLADLLAFETVFCALEGWL